VYIYGPGSDTSARRAITVLKEVTSGCFVEDVLYVVVEDIRVDG
jgi:hypothetical protein